MRSQEIFEVSDNTLRGSMDRHLIQNKFWAFKNLSRVQNKFDTIYVLGSWYGNAALILSIESVVDFDQIINVESNTHMLDVSDQLIKLLGDSRIKNTKKDVNQLNYQQLGARGLVVNFSCTNIKGNQWFDNIPKNTMVLLCCRNNDPGAINKFNSIDDVTIQYPLTKVLYQTTGKFKDPETNYTSYLVIGLK